MGSGSEPAREFSLVVPSDASHRCGRKSKAYVQVIGMKGIGKALIGVGTLGMLMGMMMFGDIGIAAMIGSIVGILSGVGFLQVAKALEAK